jgi:hypothetical protein
MNNNGFSNIIYTLMISVFGAFAKEINDKSKTNESFNIFVGEIVLHGFSGWIVGLCANKYLGLTDYTSITIFAGIGGLFGFDLVKVITKMILSTIAKSQDVELDDSDTNFDDDKRKKKNKRKGM